MSTPDQVAALVAQSLAAHTRMLQASNARAETRIVGEARAALAALLGALALDPGRTLPIWDGVSPRDRVALSNPMVGFYQQIDAEGVAEGI
jgi:hypothetical protein